MFLCILGRQPEISIAELEAVFGVANVTQMASMVAAVESDSFDLSALGGTIKYGRVVTTIPSKERNDKARYIDASRDIIKHYSKKWEQADHKITLGVSAYGFDIQPRGIQKTGLVIKSALKKHGVSVRLVPNSEAAISTAVSHNNKLGLNDSKVELLIVNSKKGIIIAESGGAQNITAYARRDQNRPKRDAFVGMLPPKLAQIMINLATDSPKSNLNILDPFCGTGTVLQEAMLRGHGTYGTDLNPKMISYSKENLQWLIESHKQASGAPKPLLEVGDAATHQWQNSDKIDAVVCETYLGQPFSAPPSPEKLKEVVGNCNHIISGFLKNIHPQLNPNTPLCIAVPAWRSKDGHLTHLPLVRSLEKYGYKLNQPTLVYSRPDQVVARELLVLTRI